MTNNNVSAEEISQFLNDVESHLTGYHIAAGYRIIRSLTYVLFLFFFSFAVTKPVSIIKMSSSTSKNTSVWSQQDTTDASFPIAIPIVGGIFFCYLVFFFIMNARYVNRREEKRKEIIQNLQVFIGQRALQFKDRGLTWVIPVNFPLWIELWKDDAVYGQGNFYGGINTQQVVGFNNVVVPGNQQVEMTYGGMVQVGNKMGYPMYTQIHPQPQQGVYMQAQPGIYMQNQYNLNTDNNKGMYV